MQSWKVWIRSFFVLFALLCVSFMTAQADEMEDFIYTIMDDGVHITQYTGNQSTVIIPAEIDNIPVVYVQMNTEFRFLPFITKVVLPNTPIVLGQFAFINTTNLRSIEGMEHVVRVESCAFSECAVQEVVFSDTLEELCHLALDGIVRSVTMPDDILVGDPLAASSLKTIHLFRGPGEQTIQTIDGVLFSADGKTLHYYPPSLMKAAYIIPEGTEYLPQQCFMCFGKACGVVFIPESVTKIETSAFSNLSSTIQIVVIEGSYAHERILELAVHDPNIQCIAVNR